MATEAGIVAPRPASTILLLRDGAAAEGRGEIEVFMMVRHYEIDFASGALVFPGGSVEKGDHEIIARPELYSGGEGLDATGLGFRIAAIRETFEESGILLARARGSKGLIDAKRARAYGERWAAFAAQTSVLPFAAIAAGRNRFVVHEIGTWRLLLGAVVYVALLAGHRWLIGVPALPQ